MFFRAGGAGRVDGVERGEEAKREYPHATRNYSYYPAYSKFRRLNEFNRVNGLNGVATIARPTKAFNSFLPSITFYSRYTTNEKRMSHVTHPFSLINHILEILRLALSLINPRHSLHILGGHCGNLLVSQEGVVAILKLHI